MKKIIWSIVFILGLFGISPKCFSQSKYRIKLIYCNSDNADLPYMSKIPSNVKVNAIHSRYYSKSELITNCSHIAKYYEVRKSSNKIMQMDTDKVYDNIDDVRAGSEPFVYFSKDLRKVSSKFTKTIENNAFIWVVLEYEDKGSTISGPKILIKSLLL